ncbi:MAG: hypothetical protein KJP09_05135 [Bacteroidia bacterium]|nr:hypothetical protein [Bacteroidia bacterium]NNK26909.1 hypothetical protein [Flavobacteriaceae bacterium]RZV64368.1 MAG: hypothetical protein EX254_05985 [Flavobacteriaceae bacterium]
MKTQLLYKAIFVLFLMPTLVLGNDFHDKWKGKYTKEKKINKEYDVNSDATLKINNSYGNLDISTWDENRIVIEVTITTNGNNEEKVQKRLDEITVNFSASEEWVAAETRFSKNKSNSWWNWAKSSNVSMKVNYLVKMPMTNNVNLSNDYGAINLGKLEGKATINCDYGKVTTDELMADDNVLTFDYTNNSYFAYVKSGKVNADYSSYTIEKTKNLDINADYTKSVVEVAEDVTYNCDYGSLTVDNVNNFRGNGDYVTIKLGDVYKNASIKSDYGSIRIDRLNKSVENVSIDSEYAGIKIGYDPAFNFNFELDLEYAGLSGDDDFEFTKKQVKSSQKYYIGHYGGSNSKGLVEINSEYGGVKFYKN